MPYVGRPGREKFLPSRIFVARSVSEGDKNEGQKVFTTKKHRRHKKYRNGFAAKKARRAKRNAELNSSKSNSPLFAFLLSLRRKISLLHSLFFVSLVSLCGEKLRCVY